MSRILDSRQLRAFVTLARVGSFTQAAKQLFLSQSAVSHSMKVLEEEVGCRLFDRVGKKISLTQAGEQFLVHAEAILDGMEKARADLEHLGKWGCSRMRLGASLTACEHILPGVLREFKARHPQCLISVEARDSVASQNLLQSGKIDLAFAIQPQDADQLEYLPVFYDELVFLTSPSHAWAVSGRVPREEVPRQNFIFYNKGSYTIRLIEKYFLEENMVLNAVMEVGSMEAIKELVKLGQGVAILAPWIAKKELEEGVLVALPLGRRKLRRNWGILHRRGHRLTLAEETFVTLCRAATETLGAIPVARAA